MTNIQDQRERRFGPDWYIQLANHPVWNPGDEDALVCAEWDTQTGPQVRLISPPDAANGVLMTPAEARRLAEYLTRNADTAEQFGGESR